MVRDDAAVAARAYRAGRVCFRFRATRPTRSRARTRTRTRARARARRQCFYKRAFACAAYTLTHFTLIRRETLSVLAPPIPLPLFHPLEKLLKHSVGELIIGRPKLIESRETQRKSIGGWYILLPPFPLPAAPGSLSGVSRRILRFY